MFHVRLDRKKNVTHLGNKGTHDVQQYRFAGDKKNYCCRNETRKHSYPAPTRCFVWWNYASMKMYWPVRGLCYVPWHTALLPAGVGTAAGRRLLVLCGKASHWPLDMVAGVRIKLLATRIIFR